MRLSDVKPGMRVRVRANAWDEYVGRTGTVLYVESAKLCPVSVRLDSIDDTVESIVLGFNADELEAV